MEQIPDHPVYSRNVLEVLTVINDFVSTLKRAETIKKDKLVEYLTKVGPLLYLKGALIPEIKVSNPDKNERFYTEEEWEILFNTLRKIFGKDDVFWHLEPDNPGEPVKASLSDHLTDIFQDLSDFLILYQKSSIDAKENAVFELHRLFISNWGIKLTIVQAQLHHLNFFSSPPQEPGFNIPNLF